MWRRSKGQGYYKKKIGTYFVKYSNIALAFNNCKKQERPALITYTVAGDNTKNNSLKILNKISSLCQ